MRWWRVENELRVYGKTFQLSDRLAQIMRRLVGGTAPAAIDRIRIGEVRVRFAEGKVRAVYTVESHDPS